MGGIFCENLKNVLSLFLVKIVLEIELSVLEDFKRRLNLA